MLPGKSCARAMGRKAVRKERVGIGRAAIVVDGRVSTAVDVIGKG